jgi:hypothetical protein
MEGHIPRKQGRLTTYLAAMMQMLYFGDSKKHWTSADEGKDYCLVLERTEIY